MKKIIYLFMVLFMVSMVKASGYLDYGISGRELEFRLGIYNDRDTRLKDVRVSAYIPGLTEIYYVNPKSSIKTNQKEYVTLLLDIPKETKPDYYPLIYTVTGKNNINMRRHTWIYIE
jgi:hypothetical protein